MKRFVAALLLTVSLPYQAHSAEAEITIGEYLELVRNSGGEGKTMYENDLKSMEQGLFWANTELRSQNRPPLYCQPDNLRVTHSLAVDLFEEAIQRVPAFKDISMNVKGMILMKALQQTFPCK